MWRTMDEATLKGKKVAELKEIAKTFGLAGYQKMRKAELIEALKSEGGKEDTAEKPEKRKTKETAKPSKHDEINHENAVQKQENDNPEAMKTRRAQKAERHETTRITKAVKQ